MNRLPSFRSHATLALCTLLHAFSHAYASMLVPLYLKMVEDLHLHGVGAASFVVSMYGAFYCLGSYVAGVLADRFDRKLLLGIGLLGNALTMVGIGLSRDYTLIVALGVVAGTFGALFHPAANALAPSHYPKSPGMAIGIMGAGSGLGFFFGPQYAGWRTSSAMWQFATVAQWQKPVIELGIFGLIFGVVFLIFGSDPKKSLPPKSHRPMGHATRKHIINLALVLMFRDFCAAAVISLASIYLQRVFHADVKSAGLAIGLMVLPSVLANPLFVYISGGRRRLPSFAIMHIVAAGIILTTPIWGRTSVILVLCAFQSLQMSGYAVSDAAMLERVDPEIRGRVVGLFLVIAGGFGAAGPFVMGRWTDWLGPRAADQNAYFGPFGLLAFFMLVSASAPLLIARLGKVTSIISPAEEISPATMPTLG